MGRLVQSRVAMGAAVDGVDPAAQRLTASFGTGHRQRPQCQVDRDAGRGEPPRPDKAQADTAQQLPDAHRGLEPVQRRSDRMQRELRADRRTDVGQFADRQGHQQ